MAIPLVGFGQKGRRLRFFGKLVEVAFHLGHEFRLQDSVCPACVGQWCSACQADQVPVPRIAALAWDVDGRKWVGCVAEQHEFSRIMEKCSVLGCAGPAMEEGRGPDMIVQGWGKATEIVALPETLGIPRGTESIPKIEERIEGLAKKSRFAIRGIIQKRVRGVHQGTQFQDKEDKHGKHSGRTLAA